MAHVLDPTQRSSPAAAPPGRPRTSWRQDLITSLLSGWIVVGAAFDAWAHINQKPDTFFTPWHGIVYSGFAVLAAWIVVTSRGALRQGLPRSARDIPIGYGLGLAGAALFLVGGIGDGFWHTLLGIEIDLEAVLSPSHLALVGGSLLMFTTALRAALGGRLPREPGLREFLPALLGLTCTVTLLTVFLGHASPFADSSATAGVPPTPARGSLGWYLNEQTFMDIQLTNLLLLSPLLLLLRYWRAPLGTATILLGTVALTHTAIHSFRYPGLLVAALVAGVAGDWCMSRARHGLSDRRAHLLTATVTPLVLWSGYFLALHLRDGLTWSAELWSGSILFACLAGLALHLLMLPPGLPAAEPDAVAANERSA